MCCYPCLLESFPFVNFKKWKILLSVELFLNIGSVFYFILLKPALLRHRFSWVAQSCPTLCDPMNRSTPGLPVQHQLLEFTQTHVHRVGDAIQPSHLLPSPSPSATSLPASESFPMSQLFSWGGQSTGVSALASVLPMNTQDWFPLGWTGWISLQSKTLKSLLQHHS